MLFKSVALDFCRIIEFNLRFFPRTIAPSCKEQFSNSIIAQGVLNHRAIKLENTKFFTEIIWHNWKLRLHFRNFFIIQNNRWNIWIGHISVILSLFFTSLRKCFLLIIKPTAGFLLDFLTFFKQSHLAFKFILSRSFNTSKTI